MFIRTRFIVTTLVVFLSAIGSYVRAGVQHVETGGFVVIHEILLPGSPESIYDAVTGDSSAAE